MKDNTKLNLVLAFLIIFGIVTLVIMALQFEKAWNSKIYRFEDGEVFCNENNMTYQIYFNGDKYCEDGVNMYPLKISNGEFKFVRFAISESTE